jgi:predicted MFS family arabinose efflux permease
VSNLLAWLGFAGSLGQQLTATAWVVLLVGIAIPVGAYVAGVLLGRRRPPGVLALVLLLALCVSQALSLSQLAFFLAVVGAL